MIMQMETQITMAKQRARQIDDDDEYKKGLIEEIWDKKHQENYFKTKKNSFLSKGSCFSQLMFYFKLKLSLIEINF